MILKIDPRPHFGVNAGAQWLCLNTGSLTLHLSISHVSRESSEPLLECVCGSDQVNNFSSNLVECIDFSGLGGATVSWSRFFRINNIELKRRWASLQLAGKFTLWHNGRRAKQPGLMHAPGVARIFQRKNEGLIQSNILLRVQTFSTLFKDERFGRFIKHRSLVDLQQTLKYVRFTKIQHTFKRWTICKDRIADLSKRLKDERRGHTNHQVS